MTQSVNQLDTFNSELGKSIEQLYEVFAKYPLNLSMDGSPLFEEKIAQWNRLVAANPLRELSVDDLRIYHFKTMTTWGEVNDFKHFLPRIFELLAELPIDFDEWVALNKLNYGKYTSWPIPEQVAVQRFLMAFWKKLLQEPSDITDAYFEGYFPAIVNVYPHFEQLLNAWLEASNKHSTQRLAEYVFRNEDEVLKGRLTGYEEMPHQGKLFLKWLRKPAVLQKLKQATSSESHPYLNLELIPILQQLEKPL
ncbi:hypothetical protein SAMN04515668_1166 [Hymenobacter arizonensis]|uniref:Uncharacterized protein n=2 Tax=Hymenobacter arizonensis TaxID=1227077 RepID=A0A1I5V2F3_HYMAR|nr:hypothetical protein SAMN04515668_1166 [Hymenobacter arizonensis]